MTNTTKSIPPKSLCTLVVYTTCCNEALPFYFSGKNHCPSNFHILPSFIRPYSQWPTKYPYSTSKQVDYYSALLLQEACTYTIL